jgi:GH24 family phage-related lysozyme (muramidase)
MTYSPEAIDLIIADEVTDRAYYEKALSFPTWPGGSSGVTIGIGYDLGYVEGSTFHSDWVGRLLPGQIGILLEVVGHRGGACHALAAELKGKISVSWEAAMSEFTEREMPYWYSQLRSTLPNFSDLHDDCQGALFSLCYNRGLGGFHLPGDRWREMRAIYHDMTNRNFSNVPVQLRSMKRLWEHQGLDGLVKRRTEEAALFERGLGTTMIAKGDGNASGS